MNNTVTYENPLRKRMKKAMGVLVAFAIIFAALLILINVLNNNNYNGRTISATGVLGKVETDDDTIYLYFENSNKKYSANLIDDKVGDFNAFVGKNVTFITPEKQFANNTPMIVGLIVDDVEVVNAEALIAEMRESNGIVILVFAILCGACAVTVCALGIARTYVQREKQYPLGQKYVEYYAEKQPNCPETKYLSLFGIIWGAALLIPILVMSIWNGIEEQSNLINCIFVGIIVFVLMAGLVVSAVLKKWLEKKNMEYYAEHYPFDFADISHVRMKKEVREQIEAEMREDLAKHPHYQGDGGNGYLVRFTEKGVELYIPDFWYDNEPESIQEPTTNVPAEDVFGLQETTTTTASDETTPFEVELENDAPKQPPVLTLTYEEANFEAVPYFKKPRPLFVVIKSRLTPSKDYPKELINDLHFLLDVNLLKTLQTFSVQVENLDNILENKGQLMLEAYNNK